MRIDDLGDLPASVLGGGQAFAVVQRIDGQRLFQCGDDPWPADLHERRHLVARGGREAGRSVAHRTHAPLPGQIGSASCRDRV